MNETRYWVWLSLIFGNANRRLWQLMNLFETGGEAYDALTSGDNGFRLNSREKNNLINVTLEQAEMLIEYSARAGIDVICYRSPDYPPPLRRIADPPAVIYCKGDITALKGRMTVTSVGTRKASQYSIAAADRICGELAENGVVIVSGFAVGIDIASHMAAANRNRPTVCVMGCGVDVDYPRPNFMYRGAILEAGGAFISEYAPGTPPNKGNFPQRNRILSALGRAAMIFEASESSGSMITATLAAEQGRTVYCLPPADIFSSDYSGNVRLLKEGAVPLFGAEDVMNCFAPESPERGEIRTEAFSILKGADPDRRRKKNSTEVRDTDVLRRDDPEKHKVTPVKIRAEKKLPEKNGRGNVSKAASAANALPVPEGTQKRITELLGDGALHADLIAQRLEIGADELLAELTELEIMGAVRSLPGRIYEINKR